MATKDNLVNIGIVADSQKIAASSKEDISAMKTIAVLKLLFIPATFVAVSSVSSQLRGIYLVASDRPLMGTFTEALFDWDADIGDSIIKARFKYHWAVTLRLIFIVVLPWSMILLIPSNHWLSRQPKSSQNASLADWDLDSVLDNDSSRSLADD